MPTAFQANAFSGIETRVVIEQALETAFTSIGSASAGARRAQSFTPATAMTATYVSLRLVRQSSPTDNVLVEIQTSSASLPSGTVVGTSTSLSAATVSTPASSWYTFAVAAPLSAATKYWIVASRDTAPDAVNFIYWKSDATNPYASNGLSTYNGSVWSAESASSDLAFRVHNDLGAFQIDRSLPAAQVRRQRALVIR